MTEEIIIDDTFCPFDEDIAREIFKKMDNRIQRLEQENKNLYEEKNCLHKIIDRLLENAGYSKDIASAEDFEDVYEDMQIKRNELIELEQENKDLNFKINQLKANGLYNDLTGIELSAKVFELEQENKEEKKAYNECMHYLACMTEQRNKLKTALEEIREIAEKYKNMEGCRIPLGAIEMQINEVLNG